MTKLLVYDEDGNQMMTLYRDEDSPMPYSYDRTLLVREFRGSSQSPLLYTTTRAMEAWNATRRTYGNAIPVGYAFKRIWEGGHGQQSQHYAGVSFDVGQRLTQSQRNEIYRIANNLGVWGYVEPISMTPTWVHFDRRYGIGACSPGSGYPVLKMGDTSTYVIILQDALNALGYSTKYLDGIFGMHTQNALIIYQQNNGLSADGICGCNTWRKIVSMVVGIGRTPSVID